MSVTFVFKGDLNNIDEPGLKVVNLRCDSLSQTFAKFKRTIEDALLEQGVSPTALANYSLFVVNHGGTRKVLKRSALLSNEGVKNGTSLVVESTLSKLDFDEINKQGKYRRENF